MTAQMSLFETVDATRVNVHSPVNKTGDEDSRAQKLFEDMALLIDRAENAETLRRAVLSLALQGRLAPRDVLDGMASTSLHQAISDRSWRLEERPPKMKLDPQIEALAGLSPVPTGWLECRLNDVAQLVNGRAYAQAELLDAGTPVIRIQNLNGGQDWYYSDLALPERQYCDTGDLLFAWSASFGPYIWAGTKAIYHYHIWKLHLSEAIDKRFLFLSLLHITELVRSQSHGLAMLHMTKGQMERWPILLPPLREQKRIVAQVDQLIALCDDLEVRLSKKRETGGKLTRSALAALAGPEITEDFDTAWKRIVENFDVLIDRAEKVGELRRMILELAVRGRLIAPGHSPVEVDALLETVGRQRRSMLEGRRKGGRGHGGDADLAALPEPYQVPGGWRWCTLEEIAGHIVDGTHHTPRYVDSGMDFISAKDIKDGRISFDGCRQISREEFDELTKRCRPKRGDVLVTKSGSIGEVALVETDRRFTLFESVAVIPVVPAMNSVYVTYVVYLGASGQFGAENQRGVAVRHLHLVDLRRLPFPLPSRTEQDAIVAKVELLLKFCDQLEERLRQTETQATRLVGALVQELET